MQVGFVLPGKGGLGGVFCCSGGSHGNGEVFTILCFEFGIIIKDLLLQVIRDCRMVDKVTTGCAAFLQLLHIVRVKVVKLIMKLLPQVVVVEYVLVRRSGNGKSVRDTHTLLSQVLVHLTK